MPEKPPEKPPEPEQKGAKARSETPYPYYGLTRVTDIVKAVQRVAGNGAAAAGDLQSELNVTKTDRMWAYGIPAAILFGVIERIGRGDDAQIKLTDLGKRLALPGPPDEERATKANVFKQPDLYARLLEQFAGNPVPTKDVLKNILQREFKILESMAGNAADAFLDSLKVADLVTTAGTISVGGTPADDMTPPGNDPPPPPATPPGMKNVSVPDDFIVYRAKIGNGRIIDIPLPPKFTKADADRLYAFLQTQVDDDFGP